MNQLSQRNFCVFVTGFPEDTDRKTLKSAFIIFGHIEKLYLENSGKFAKVFYANKESCDLAIRELNNNNSLGWQVEYFVPKLQENLINKSLSSISSDRSSDMAGYREPYNDDEEDFSENFDYCNVHGQPLTVLQADMGDLYVNLKDIRKTGFALFRRDTFDSIPVDKRQIGKEFELHLLSEAKNYILKNKVAVIHEDDILKTIERCKNILLGETSLHDNRNNFGAGRYVAPAPRNNMTITREIHSSPSTANPPTSSQIPNQRPPKSLPTNFMPTNKSNEKYRSRSKERAPKSHQNGSIANNEPKYNNNYNNENRVRNNFVKGFDTPKQKREPSKEPTERNASHFSETKPDVQKSKPVVKETIEETKAKSPLKADVSKPAMDVESKPLAEKVKNQPKAKTPVKADIGKLVLDIGSTYEVQVVHVEEKENICWVQKKTDADLIEDTLLQINEAEEDLDNIKPVVGQLVIAQFEGAWSRGRVTSDNPLMVHFIDYGNKSPVESVKPLLDSFKKIPALAGRIKISASNEFNKDITELTIKVRQQYEDESGTYLVNLAKSTGSSSETESLPTKPSKVEKQEVVKHTYYFETPKSMADLKNGDKVMLVDIEVDRFYVRTKDCALKCKEITEYIKNLDKSALTLPNVKVNQLVLGSKDGLVGLYRAVVTNKENESVVTVKYVDFPGEDSLSMKSVRNVDKFLANEPSCIILTPEIKCLKDTHEIVTEYILKICQNKEKFTVVLSNGEFDLQFDDGTLLSEKVIELRSPKKSVEVKSSNPKPTKESEKIPKSRKSTGKITYDDMDWVTIEPGSHSFLCYRFNTLDDITMLDSREEVINYFEEITGLEVTDDVPYTPEELEMCLVLYKGPDDDEASWCRATVLSVEDDSCDVNFVDFGNRETVESKDIRKFPPNLKSIPMLGINCELTGIPNTPELLKYVKELLPEGDQVDVLVKGLCTNVDHKYKIEIPAIYKVLQEADLI